KELIDELAKASKEQADGISQITETVSNMDKVVQGNAASSEESAAAAEEMSSQAMGMMAIVEELVKIVGSRNHQNTQVNNKIKREYRPTRDYNKEFHVRPVEQNKYPGQHTGNGREKVKADDFPMGREISEKDFVDFRDSNK
ncbi:MAG: hypothetical protein OEZ36_07595, partial [Spirochaetota bacterium]|nr:hypothetical protein [Spirochaetota bacterium]